MQDEQDAAEQPHAAAPKASPRPGRKRRWPVIAGIVLLIAFVVVVIVLAKKWPFTRGRMEQSLSKSVPSSVTFAKFHAKFFPHPGCVAEGVVFTELGAQPGSPPLVSIGRLTIEAAYTDLVTRPGYIAGIVLEGLRVQIPPRGSVRKSPSQQYASNTRVGKITADGAVLEIGREDGKPPLVFKIHTLTVNSVSRDTTMSYKTMLENAVPPGEIVSTGRLGPWDAHDPGKTPLSGDYEFQNADLGVFHGVAGTLSSRGSFQGVLGRIEASGSVQIPDFSVTASHHAQPLAAKYRAYISGINGNVQLERVDASLIGTQVVASGNIASEEGRKGKVTDIDFSVSDGRVQDVLQLFVSKLPPPLNGLTSFKGHATVLPLGRPFLKELELKGDFGIESGHFNHPETKEKIAELSARAQGGKDPDPAKTIADLRGHADLHEGVASLSGFSFRVPGAHAQMHGTYDLLNERVNLHGTLKTEAELSNQAKGFKSVLLKPFDFIFKTKRHGAVVPVKLTGTYSHPQPGLDIDPDF